MYRKLIVAISLLAFASDARPYCLSTAGPLRTSTGAIVRSMSVKLVVTSLNQQYFLGMPIAEAEANIKAVLGAWWDEGGANIRLHYEGKTTATGDTNIILIRETTNCSVCYGSAPACESDHMSGSYRIGATIWIGQGSLCGNQTWVSQPFPPVSGTSFREVLLHEMGHAFGMFHPQDPPCNQPITSVMSNAAGSIVPRRDDIEGLGALYIEPNPLNPESWLSFDMLSWVEGGPRNYSPPRFRPLAGGLTRLDGYRKWGATSSTFRATIVYDNASSIVSMYPDNSSSGLTYQATAMAIGPNDLFQILAWNANEDNTMGWHGYERIALTQNGWASWTLIAPGGRNLTMAHPTATYDPVSNKYITFWDRGSGRGGYVTLNPDGSGQYIPLNDAFVDTLHAPVAACATAGNLNNCVVAWDQNNAYGCLSWAEFKVNADGSLSVGTTKRNCYLQEDTPALLFRQEDPGNLLWGLAFRQQETVFTFRKSYAGTLWQDQRAAVWNPTDGVRSPALLEWLNPQGARETNVYVGGRY